MQIQAKMEVKFVAIPVMLPIHGRMVGILAMLAMVAILTMLAVVAILMIVAMTVVVIATMAESVAMQTV